MAASVIATGAALTRVCLMRRQNMAWDYDKSRLCGLSPLDGPSPMTKREPLIDDSLST